MKTIYDPFEFVGKIELLTIAIVGSFITTKLLNCLYDTIYEPLIDTFIDTNKAHAYYVKIGSYYVKIDKIVKELVKWIFLIVALMIFYNFLVYRVN